VATLEARSKKSLKQQGEILDRLERIEAKLDALAGGTPTPAREAPPASGFESASALDISATNRNLKPTPQQQKGR
jgi:hypothetical protein